MRFTSILSAFTALIASAAAAPGMVPTERQVGLCASGNPQCCDVDVLGVADLDCETPSPTPTDLTSFNQVCADVGKIDMCCLIPILGQGLLCSSPDGS